MTLLIAAIITTATFPGTMTLTGTVDPPEVYAVIPDGTAVTMIHCPFMAHYALPSEVRSATAFVVMASGVEIGRGRVQWQADLPTPTPIPEPATREHKITNWPPNPIQPPGNWIPREMAKYIHGREKKSLHLEGFCYNGEIKRYLFRWKVR